MHFDMHAQVVDIDFDISADKITVADLHIIDKNGAENEIVIGGNDYVFMTNGSLTESTDSGSWTKPAVVTKRQVYFGRLEALGNNCQER